MYVYLHTGCSSYMSPQTDTDSEASLSACVSICPQTDTDSEASLRACVSICPQIGTDSWASSRRNQKKMTLKKKLTLGPELLASNSD
jgi:hypothetical protein